jgi:hypothetical protein
MALATNTATKTLTNLSTTSTIMPVANTLPQISLPVARKKAVRALRLGELVTPPKTRTTIGADRITPVSIIIRPLATIFG